MNLYRKVWTNLASGAEVAGDWHRTEGAARTVVAKGEAYMHSNRNYSQAIIDRQVGLMEWLRRKPKT